MSEFDNEALDILQEKPEEGESRSDSRYASPTTVARDSGSAEIGDIVAEDGGADHGDAIKGEILSRRQRDFHALLEAKLRNPDVPKEEKDMLVTAYRRMDWRDDDVKAQLPNFIEWCYKKMGEKDIEMQTYYERKDIWSSCLREHKAMAYDMVSLLKKSKEEDLDQEKVDIFQKMWWYQYHQLNILRSFVLSYFQLGELMMSEMMPDRIYLGTLMSEEDFVWFMGKHHKVIKLQEGVNIDDPAGPPV